MSVMGEWIDSVIHNNLVVVHDISLLNECTLARFMNLASVLVIWSI